MVEPASLSQAIVVWTGFGRTPWPKRDEQRVVDTFGEDFAVDVMPQIRTLEAEFFESSARRWAPDVARMGDEAAQEFRRRHPELSHEAVEALAWCYTFEYR